jgi:hypothetical protein
MNVRPLRTLALALTTLAAACAGNSTGSTGSAGTSGGTAGTKGAGGTTSTGTGGTSTGAGGTNSTGTGGTNSAGAGGTGPTGVAGTTGAGGTSTGSGGHAGTGAGGATTGTAGTTGATSFCPSDAIFCADFEEASGVPINNPVGMATFEDPSEYGMTFGTVMALDKTAPYDGNQSLKIDPSSSFSIRTLAVSVPAKFWVRLYIKSDQAIGQQEHNSFFAAGLGPDYSTAKNVEVSEQFGCVLLNANDTLFPAGTTCGANTALSANAWHCMATEFDGTTGNVQVFAGATQIINAVGFTNAQESFNTFSFGYFSYNAPSGNPPNPPTVWFDDVVVSASPLSCP